MTVASSTRTHQTDAFERVNGRAEEQRYLRPVGHRGPGAEGRQVDQTVRQDDAQTDGHREVGDRRQGRDELQIPDHGARHDGHQSEYHVNVYVHHGSVFVAKLTRDEKKEKLRIYIYI